MNESNAARKPWLSRLASRHIWRLASFLVLLCLLALQLSGSQVPAGRGGPIDRLDALLYDWRFQLLPPEREPILPIVIVDLDEATQQREGRWPWDRGKVAALIQALRGHGATLIGFDVVFSEPGVNPASVLLASEILPQDAQRIVATNEEKFDGDAVLAATLDPYVVLGYFLHADGASAGVLPPPFLLLDAESAATSTVLRLPDYTGSLPILLSSGASSGFVVAIPDSDGVVRRMPMVLRHGDGVYTSLSLEMARLALGAPWVRLQTAQHGGMDIVTGLHVGPGLFVPLDKAGSLLIPYRGGARSYLTLSATEVLRGDAPASELAALQNAIVLVGTSALGLSDLRTTPLQTGFPGVEAHANVLDALLLASLGANAFYHRPDWADGAAFAATVVLGLVLALVLPGQSPRTMLALVAALLVVLVGANGALWHYHHMALPLAAPLLVALAIALINIVGGYLSANRQRRAIQSLFSEYVPAAYVERIVNAPAAVSLAGEQRHMTVLFADVRNFTAISEPLSATQVKLLLNRYLSSVTEIIFAHQGTIDKYVGDLVMAFWNAPLDDAHHASHAVSAALAMQEGMQVLRREFADEGLPKLQIGVGLNTGPMNVGDMGSRFRRAYTVLGDAVNLGARLESLTAFYNVPILVSEYTRNNAAEFLYRTVDHVKVKGRSEAVEIFQPLCLKGAASAEQLDRVARYEQAVTHYRAGDWGLARAAFQQLYLDEPDPLYQLYLDRLNSSEEHPPAGWSAVFTHFEK